jgi:transcriptional regulator with XRE-family HTH domain
MAAYASQARLLRVWRTDIARWTQAEVAEYLSENVAEYPSTNKATISMWERARRGLTFEALYALDDCYQAAGALADMAQALGTPFGLPARRSWVRYPSGAYGTGWALLRPTAGHGRIDARLTWGPLSFRIAEPCGDEGILLQLPLSAPDVVIAVHLDEPGWVDFGRGRAHVELGIPVHDVPASPALAVDGPVPPGLVSAGLADRLAGDPDLAEALLELFGARPDLARQAFAAGPATDADGELLIVDRPHPDGAVPRFTGEQYRTLRNGRCFTLSDAAAKATALLPQEPVSADRIRRFERGATPQAEQLRARLDHVYDAGGHTCNERVGVPSYRAPFTVTFPRYWVGPVWFAFSSDRYASGPVVIHRRGVQQRLLVVSGASVTSTRVAVDDTDPFTIECRYGWRVTAGMGARPAAPEIRLPLRDLGKAPGGEIHDDLLSLFGKTRKDLESLLDV